MYEDFTSGHNSQNLSLNMPSFGDMSEMNVFNEMPNILQTPFNSTTKQISIHQTATSESKLSQAIDSITDSTMTSMDFGETTYRPIFSSTYIIDQVKRIANKRKKEFSITKMLPLALKRSICECCLCCIRQKNNLQIELSERFCICMDSLKRKCDEKYAKCKRDSISKNSNRSCQNCLNMMVTSSKRNHQTKLIKCEMMICNFTAKRPSTMKEHYKKHLIIKNFECSMCERGFETKSILRKHERSHLNTRIFSFSSSSSSRKSIKTII